MSSTLSSKKNRVQVSLSRDEWKVYCYWRQLRKRAIAERRSFDILLTISPEEIRANKGKK